MRFASFLFLAVVIALGLPARAAIPSVKVVNGTTSCVRVTLYAGYLATDTFANMFPVGSSHLIRPRASSTIDASKGGTPAFRIVVRAEPLARADCSGKSLGVTQSMYQTVGPTKEIPTARVVKSNPGVLVKF